MTIPKKNPIDTHAKEKHKANINFYKQQEKPQMKIE